MSELCQQLIVSQILIPSPPNDITNWISILPFRKVKFNDGSFIFTRNDLRDFFLNDNKVVAVKVLIPSKLASLLPHFDFRISKPLVEFSCLTV